MADLKLLTACACRFEFKRSSLAGRADRSVGRERSIYETKQRRQNTIARGCWTVLEYRSRKRAPSGPAFFFSAVWHGKYGACSASPLTDRSVALSFPFMCWKTFGAEQCFVPIQPNTVTVRRCFVSRTRSTAPYTRSCVLSCIACLQGHV
jgi:hypothetical protein